MKSALISDATNIVDNIIIGELEGYIPCPDDVEIGFLYVDGDFVPPVAVVDLEQIKRDGAMTVDTEAENVRLQFITTGSGQAMVYQEKVAQAQAYEAATVPQDADYPLLMAESNVTGMSIDLVAQNILDTRAQWLLIATAIEQTRLQAKEDIQAALTPEEVYSIITNLVWPEPTE